jgi:hypothetical protein
MIMPQARRASFGNLQRLPSRFPVRIAPYQPEVVAQFET